MDTKQSNIFLKMVQTPLWDTTDDLVDGDVITIYQNDRVDRALRQLCDNNILSCPVVDANDRYVGMVDMMTILDFALGIFDQTFRPSRWSDDYLSKKRNFRTALVTQVMHRRSQTKHTDINEDYSLLHAVETMSIADAHRLAITEEGRFVTGLITHSMVIKWLVNNMAEIPQSLLQTTAYNIRPFNILSTIPVDRKAIDAFRIMKSQRLHSVAVVDGLGSLVDVISQRDLRGVKPESLTFRFLWNSISHFKDQVRKDYTEAPTSPVCVTSQASLEQILNLFVSQHVHQIFVVSDDRTRRPMDVISMGDCIKFILDEIKEA